MNIKTIEKKMGHFRIAKIGNVTLISSRASDSRVVRVIDQGSSIVALPIVLEADGSQRVAFHATTVKSLIEFLEGK